MIRDTAQSLKECVLKIKKKIRVIIKHCIAVSLEVSPALTPWWYIK